MDVRKETLCGLKMCRFCLNRNESLSTMYEGSKAPKTAVPLSLKILYCIGLEIFPSDKMPQFICNRCKFFMEISYAFKQICRQADERLLQYVQHGSPIESINWPAALSKVFRAMNKSTEGVVETVVQSGETKVKVTAEEVSDSEEGEDDDVYNVKIADGPEEGKRVKVVTDTKCKDSEDSVVAVSQGCWPCDQCDCTYPLEQLLSLHKAQKHRARKIECRDCDAKFFTKYDLCTHQLIHTDDMPFQCVACGRKFKRLILLKRHEKTMHAELPQKMCPDCPATFLSMEELTAHKQRHEKYTNRPYVCDICGKRFHDRVMLVKHIENVHTKKPAFGCHYCPEQFSTVSRLTRHVKAHAGERPYPCKHCDKSFLKSHHYTRHLRLKHREGEVTASEYRCEECGTSLRSQDELMYHSALHATRNLVCPLCQEKFEDVDTVTAHIKSHVTGTEYMCDFCELIFTTKEKLDAHIAKAHDDELLANEQDMDETSMDMDAEDDDDNSINLTEEDGHMVVQLKKADDYMLPNVDESEDQIEKVDLAQSEESEAEETLPNITNELEKSLISESPSKAAEALKMINQGRRPSVVIEKCVMPTPATAAETSDVVSCVVAKQADTSEKTVSNIIKKPEEVKPKLSQLTSGSSNTAEKSADKKDKSNNNNKVVSSSTATGASEKSLRLLEKELQELKRTSRPELKTPSKPVEANKNKRPQIHTSTPKTRSTDKKEVQTPKTVAEKPAFEKKVLERRAVPKENKEPKELKLSTVKEDEGNNTKEDESTEKKEAKDTSKTSVKNGVSEKPNLDDSVRRSTRPCKIKDYAKMIRDDRSSSGDESDEAPEEDDEGNTEGKTSKMLRGRPRKKTFVHSPMAGAKKRGRPRKEKTPVVPAKIKKDDTSEDEAKPKAEPAKEAPVKETPVKEAPVKETPAKAKSDVQIKPKESTPTPENKPAQLKPANESNSNILVSPSGQTLKRVPIKSLPPGVKPLPLPRSMGAGEVCEMQIGKKVVKVQKIVMTKAEVEAMAKKGLVEMKDGTMVLKQGIKLPTVTDASGLKATMAAEADKKQESPK